MKFELVKWYKMEDWVLKLNRRLSFYHRITVVKSTWKNPGHNDLDYGNNFNGYVSIEIEIVLTLNEAKVCFKPLMPGGNRKVTHT